MNQVWNNSLSIFTLVEKTAQKDLRLGLLTNTPLNKRR
ncbi:hypothetical protein (plasmid) [Metabacillus dongyingensis]|nr:hypothetical protein [Metabacillus dongyingensis]